MDPEEIIAEALEAAIMTMNNMIVNNGQKSVLDDYIVPVFRTNAQATPFEGWNDVSAGPYIDFMGQTTEAGNQIMEKAYKIAKIIQLLGYAT
jgi:hypothetical protein